MAISFKIHSKFCQAQRLFTPKLILSTQEKITQSGLVEIKETVQQRRILKARRQQLPLNRQRKAAQNLITHLRQLPALRLAKKIALYLPQHNEIDISLLIPWLAKSGKEIYLPTMAPLKKRRLSFVPLRRDTVLRRVRWNLCEPQRTKTTQIVEAQILDVIILPLVAFDQQGNRLGMGKGFYDATLSFKRSVNSTKPQLIGVAYDWQEVINIQPQTWDIALNLIVTNQRIIIPKAYSILN